VKHSFCLIETRFFEPRKFDNISRLSSTLWLCLEEGDSSITVMASAVRKIVKTAAAPGAIGPYNQAVIAGDTMYISGQLGMDAKTMELVGPDVESQAKQALTNMGEILKCAGLTFNNVVKTTVLLKDINDFVKVNDVYKTFFTSNFPARAAYQVAALPKGGAVEIEAVALVAADIKDEIIEKKCDCTAK